MAGHHPPPFFIYGDRTSPTTLNAAHADGCAFRGWVLSPIIPIMALRKAAAWPSSGACLYAARAEADRVAACASKTGQWVCITVPAPAQPPLILGGKISEPTEPISFAGNWWAKTERGLLKMSSTVPHALASDAQLTLTTRADNPLGRLIGADTLSFAALQRFNIFKQAQTAVSLQQPVTSNSVQKRSNL